MSVEIEFLGPLKQLVNGAAKITVQGASVRSVLSTLDAEFEAVSKRLLDADGNLHNHINIFVNEEDIRFTGALDTPLKDGDQITVISAIAGG